MITGAPYAAIGRKRLEILLSLVSINKKDVVVDLGSGDGRIVIELAKHAKEAHGYEINPLLVLISIINIKRAGVKNAHIHWKSMWHEDFSRYNLITIYCSGHIMGNLEEKLQKEAKKGTRILMNYYHFPTWKPKKKKQDAYLYIK